MKLIDEIIEKYKFKEDNSGLFIKPFDGGYLFLMILSNNKTVRLMVGQSEECYEYHDAVDIFEFTEISKLDRFMDLIEL